jgi:hypothetical protein
MNPVFQAQLPLIAAYVLLGLLFYPEDGGSMFLRNVDELLSDYTSSYHRRKYSSEICLFTPSPGFGSILLRTYFLYLMNISSQFRLIRNETRSCRFSLHLPFQFVSVTSSPSPLVTGSNSLPHCPTSEIAVGCM